MTRDALGRERVRRTPQYAGIAHAMHLDAQPLNLACDFTEEGVVAREVRGDQQQRTAAREPGRVRHRPESYRPARRPSLAAIRRWHGERVDRNGAGVRRARWRETPSPSRSP